MKTRAEMVAFIKKTKPEWTGLYVAGVKGSVVPFDAVPDKNIAGVYFSLVRKIKSGNTVKKPVQLELALGEVK